MQLQTFGYCKWTAHICRTIARATHFWLTCLNRFLFGLPDSIDTNIARKEYDIVLNDYKKAQSLFADTQVYKCLCLYVSVCLTLFLPLTLSLSLSWSFWIHLIIWFSLCPNIFTYFFSFVSVIFHVNQCCIQVKVFKQVMCGVKGKIVAFSRELENRLLEPRRPLSEKKQLLKYLIEVHNPCTLLFLVFLCLC